MATLQDKTVFITGASRGIGKAIGLRFARDGANIVLFAKTAEPDPRLPGTIYTAAEEMEAAGARTLVCLGDIRDDQQMEDAVNKAVETFGGIDILVNNASAINLTPTEETDMKRFDLMHQINTRGTFLASKVCLPHLRQAANPHVVNLSPPLDMQAKWFAPHCAYTMAKYGMSLCVLGMSKEYQGQVAFNALWPRTVINTAAVQNLLGGEAMVQKARQPEVMADAAHAIVTRDAREYSGHFLVDDEVLRGAGVTDLSAYQVDPELPASQLMPDFFLEEKPG